jgi:hypothetical protein
MTRAFRLIPLLALLLIGACATLPSGPGVMVLPGTGKSFDQFRADDFDCRQFASMQVGGAAPNQTATDSGLKSAAVGTVVGAAAGALVNGSSGAAVGAGTGLVVGALAGTGAAEDSAYGLQRRYDYAYIQCMYAKGHKVPVSGNLMSSNPNQAAPYTPPPPPPPGSPPPPPPGTPPPR